jgi:hypothetical protein
MLPDPNDEVRARSPFQSAYWSYFIRLSALLRHMCMLLDLCLLPDMLVCKRIHDL